MKIEIISTGEEILTGAVTDTNTAYIAQKLDEKGYKIIRHTTVGDSFDGLVALFIESGKRSDVTIVSGGLGPTSDDLTAQAAASAYGCDLIENPEAVASVTDFFKAFGRKMSETDRKQTRLPAAAACLPNAAGTAPGFTMTIRQARFYFIPGVPREMKQLLNTTVMPAIDRLSGKNTLPHYKKSLFLFGLPEARVSELIKDIKTRCPDVVTGFRADFPVIEVKLAMDAAIDKAQRKFDTALAWVESQLKPYVFSYESGDMAAEVGRLLSAEKKTVAIAESCTGGLIGHRLTEIAGSSDYFLSSCVTYANSAKMAILGVQPETLAQYGAVSPQVVREMAGGVRTLTGSDYALATSGIAGPGGGSDEKPVGTVFIGISGPSGTQTLQFISPFKIRHQNKIIFAVKSLDLLRQTLLADK